MGSIISNKDLVKEIEEIVRTQREKSFIDAIITLCEKHDIEPESIAKILDKPTIERLRHEYGNLNYLKKSKGKLPL